MLWKEKEFLCHVDLALHFMGGKWKAYIIWNLQEKTLRFSQLQKMLPGVSKKVLTEQLNQMEQDELITRKIYPEVPARVEYSITELGMSLYEAMIPLKEWAEKLLQQNTSEADK